MTKEPKPKPQQIDAHYLTRPAAVQALGFNGQITDPAVLKLAAEAGAQVIRGGGGWQGVEDPVTGELKLPEKLTAALRECAALKLKPMLIAGYGAPYRTLTRVTVATNVPAGIYTIPCSPIPTIAEGTDFIIGKNGGNLTERHSYPGSLIVGSKAGSLMLAAALGKELKAGDSLTINRVRYAPPADRSLTNPSREAFVRYATFLGKSIADAGCEGYVCLWNEPPWPDDLWIDRRDSYDAPPAGMSGGGMHTLIAQFFGKALLPDGVKFISGATDKNGGPASILKAYQPEVTNNKGANYIPLPTPTDLADFAGEGIHPYGGHQPEASAWDDNFTMLSPIENQSAFPGVTQHQQTWGRNHGYTLETFATECGGNGKYGEDKHARYDLRRVISLWMMGVPLACLYNLGGHNAFSVVEANDDGTYTAKESYEALGVLMDIMEGCGSVGPAPQDPPRFVSAQGNTFPMVSGAFSGAVGSALFVWQRTWGEGKGNEEDGWMTIPSPTPATVTVAAAGMVTGFNVRTGVVVPLTGAGSGLYSLPVSDDPIAIVN